jgi:hypothetical protein
VKYLLQVVQKLSQSLSRRKRMVIALIIALAASGMGLLLALEHRPAWYAPPSLTETELQQGRMEAMRVVDLVGDQLVDQKPFEIVLSDDQLNVWLSGLGQIWPEAARRIPPEIVEPFVFVEPGILSTAARLESKGWRAIVSSEYILELSIDREKLVVVLNSVRCGTVTLPRFIVAPLFKPYMQAEVVRGYSVHQLYHGLQLENRFIWPNGRRPFRIGALSLESGRIRLRIEPL